MTSRDTALVWVVGGRSAVVAMATMSISVSLRPAGLRSTSRTDLRCGSTITLSMAESLRTIASARLLQAPLAACRRPVDLVELALHPAQAIERLLQLRHRRDQVLVQGELRGVLGRSWWAAAGP